MNREQRSDRARMIEESRRELKSRAGWFFAHGGTRGIIPDLDEAQRQAGRLGGQTTARRLTQAQRSTRARAAAMERWRRNRTKTNQK